MTKPRGTCTLVHETGVTWSTDDIADAAALSGWPGWLPVGGTDLRPLGLDLSGASVAGLRAYAEAMALEVDVGSRATRAEVEAAIRAASR